MNEARQFQDKLSRGERCFGTGITCSDPSVTEALCPDFDFFWIDMEHSTLSLQAVKHHLMAIKGSETAALVRVPWNDAVLIKPVLDAGADGIIVPMVSTADEARQAVAACRYPPEGVRGFGPLRPLNYGRLNATEFVAQANEEVLVIVQIETREAIDNIAEILAVPGLGAISFGPQDLSAAMGYRTQPNHPEVEAVMRNVIEKAETAGIPVGTSVGLDPDMLCHLLDMGLRWISTGVDVTLMIRAAQEVVGKVRTWKQQ